MELKLTSYNIADLGSMLSDKLYELGITDSTLVIKLPSKEFKKVDEDLLGFMFAPLFGICESYNYYSKKFLKRQWLK